MEKLFGSEYLQRYHHERGWPMVSNDLWEELDGKESVPVSTPLRFYHPKKNLRKDWPDFLKQRYDLEENVFYDPKVSGVTLEVTAEMLAEEKRKTEEDLRSPRCHFDSEKQREDFIRGAIAHITPRSYIRGKKFGLVLEMMEETEPAIPGIKKVKQRYYDDLTEFEKKVLEWNPEYGVLIDHRKKAGVLFPAGKDQDIRYEVLREYFFHSPSYPELFISLAQEINTNRAIWGLRRSLGLDWPFDSPRNERRPGEVHPLAGAIPEFSNLENQTVRGVVTELNEFIQTLEQMLS